MIVFGNSHQSIYITLHGSPFNRRPFRPVVARIQLLKELDRDGDISFVTKFLKGRIDTCARMLDMPKTEFQERIAALWGDSAGTGT